MVRKFSRKKILRKSKVERKGRKFSRKFSRKFGRLAGGWFTRKNKPSRPPRDVSVLLEQIPDSARQQFKSVAPRYAQKGASEWSEIVKAAREGGYAAANVEYKDAVSRLEAEGVPREKALADKDVIKRLQGVQRVETINLLNKLDANLDKERFERELPELKDKAKLEWKDALAEWAKRDAPAEDAKEAKEIALTRALLSEERGRTTKAAKRKEDKAMIKELETAQDRVAAARKGVEDVLDKYPSMFSPVSLRPTLELDPELPSAEDLERAANAVRSVLKEKAEGAMRDRERSKRRTLLRGGIRRRLSKRMRK